jgi:hypothetical protein
VVATVPADGEVRVDRLTQLAVEFSEEMDRRSAERSFSAAPRVELGNFKWRGRTLLAQPRQELPDSTTFVIRIGGNARDYHGVSIAAPYTFAFSTGLAVDSGVIAGTVIMQDDPVPDAVVWACRHLPEPDSLGNIDRCGYVGATSADGTFRLEHIQARATPYALVAFLDLDENAKYGVASESGKVLDGAAIVREPGDSIGGIRIPIAAPNGG